MSLPEDLRQEYLQVLGIDSYFPRVRLPGAPEPVACVWPESWQTPSSEPPLVTEQPSRRETPAKPAPKRAESRPRPGEAKTLAEIPAPARAVESNQEAEPKKSAQQAEDVRLQVLCIRVNDSLAILNVMPHLGPQQLSAHHRTLLLNLLRTSGITHEQMQIDEKPFRWPLVQGEQMDNSRSAAALALSAFLQQKHSDWQFSSLLVMGEMAIKQMFSAEDETTSPSAMDSQPWKISYTRSLDECLQRSSLKREVWSVIRQYRS